MTKGADVDHRTPRRAETGTPQYAECLDCEHRWVVAYLPMALEIFAEVIGAAHCPACGADSARQTLTDTAPAPG